MQNNEEGASSWQLPDGTGDEGITDPAVLYYELLQIIVEQRIQIGKLRSQLADAKMEAQMAPKPHIHNVKLRRALAQIDWDVSSLNEARAVARDALMGKFYTFEGDDVPREMEEDEFDDEEDAETSS